MDIKTQIREHIAACFTGLWITTSEPDDAQAEVIGLAIAQAWDVHTWDIDRGLDGDPTRRDPVEAIHSLASSQAETTILIMRNLHRYTSAPDVMQALDTALSEGKDRRTFIIATAPVVEIPQEIERQWVVIEHALPAREQLRDIARNIASQPGELPDGPALETLLDASAGLTRVEAEGAYSLSIARHGKIRADEVWDLKTQALRKSGLMTLHRNEGRFDDLGGLGALKDFAARALRPGRPATARPRGILLLGVPGTGKSAIAKAIGTETGRPTLALDFGALMGSLVGQTEERTRRALAIADAMAPAVLFMDEVEKGLAGAGSSGQTDSGVTARMFGTFLTWLNDHTSDVFVVATSNNIGALPPEFTRAERFDGVFFLDFPTDDVKRAIWTQYMDRFGLPRQDIPADRDWTGAEIKSTCRLATLLDVPLTDAARNVVPIASTNGERVQALREWANGRCIDAEKGGIYTNRTPARTATPTKSNRKIHRPIDPEAN